MFLLISIKKLHFHQVLVPCIVLSRMKEKWAERRTAQHYVIVFYILPSLSALYHLAERYVVLRNGVCSCSTVCSVSLIRRNDTFLCRLWGKFGSAPKVLKDFVLVVDVLYYFRTGAKLPLKFGTGSNISHDEIPWPPRDTSHLFHGLPTSFC